VPVRTTYSDRYRHRIERRLGMTIEAARDRGIKLQRARGHRPREHITRDIRRKARGALTEGQRGFVRRQRKRAGGDPDEPQAWELEFELMPHEERERIRLTQSRYLRGYKSSKAPNKRGVNYMRAGNHGFVEDHLDMGLYDAEEFGGYPLPLLFYH
jgi:hypothetical protein